MIAHTRLMDRSFSSIKSSIKDAESEPRESSQRIAALSRSSSSSNALFPSRQVSQVFWKFVSFDDQKKKKSRYALFLERFRLDGEGGGRSDFLFTLLRDNYWRLKLKEFAETLSNFWDYHSFLMRFIDHCVIIIDSLWLKKFPETFLLSFLEKRAWETIFF